MNEIVKQTQEDYRKVREESDYSLIDVGEKLKNLAEKGLIWVLKDLRDTTEFEEIVIDSYSNKYRATQVYDNLEDYFLLQPSSEASTKAPFQTPQKPTPQEKPKKKKKNTLEVRNVKQFKGYLKAKELEEKTIGICKTYPSYERDHIVNQIERSVSSIKERIEIGEQIYVGEKFNQYSIAIGSAKETSAWLQISLGQRYITQVQFDELDNLATQVICILTKNLSNINEKEGKGMDLPSPYTPDVKKFGAYKNALLLVEKIYEITRKPEFWQEKNLVRKIRKHATSSVANIAEAHQLYVPKKFRFFNDSLKALQGLGSSLDTSLNKEIISKESLKEIYELMNSIRNVLSKKMKNISDEKAG